jgi:hypothetical protein
MNNCKHTNIHPARIDGLHTVYLDCNEHLILSPCRYASGLSVEEDARKMREKCDAQVRVMSFDSVMSVDSAMRISKVVHESHDPAARMEEIVRAIRAVGSIREDEDGWLKKVLGYVTQ